MQHAKCNMHHRLPPKQSEGGAPDPTAVMVVSKGRPQPTFQELFDEAMSGGFLEVCKALPLVYTCDSLQQFRVVSVRKASTRMERIVSFSKRAECAFLAFVHDLCITRLFLLPKVIFSIFLSVFFRRREEKGSGAVPLCGDRLLTTLVMLPLPTTCYVTSYGHVHFFFLHEDILC